MRPVDEYTRDFAAMKHKAPVWRYMRWAGAFFAFLPNVMYVILSAAVV